MIVILYFIFKILLYLPIKLIFPTRIYGRNKLKKGGNILICNHYSAWDIFIVAMAFPRKLNFVGKKELFEKPLIAKLLRAFGASPIDREKVEHSQMKTIVKKLKEEKTIMLFPEGTRNKADMVEKLNTVKNGAAMFALMSGKPVTPMILLKFPRPFRLNRLFVGDTMTFESFSLRQDREAINKAGEKIRLAMEELVNTGRQKSGFKSRG